MSANVELQLLATMLHTGDFSPITSGEITRNTFSTHHGQILHDFITSFREEGEGNLRYPSLGITRHRFASSAIDIPDPGPADNVDTLAHAVKRESFRTKVLSIATNLCKAAELESEAGHLPERTAEAVALLKGELLPIKRAKRASLAEDIQDVLERYDTGLIQVEGMPWPWPMFQRATRGMHKKDFYVIAGRPKSRKTFVAIAAAAHVVRKHRARVLFITPEMPPEQILLRFIASLCQVRYSEFKDSSLNEAEEFRLMEAARMYGMKHGESREPGHYSLRMQDTWGVAADAIPCFEVVQGTSQTVSWVESQIEIYHPDVVIVDSFYRLRTEGGRKNDADWKVVTAISRSLKDLAMNTGTCVIGTHQMNRDAEGKIGSIGNLSLADAVGQDADLIVRVVTGKIEGDQRSAIVVLGGREVPYDGVIINNKPCYDYSEVGVITSKKQVEQLLKSDDEEEEGDDAKTEAKKKKAEAKREAKKKVRKMRGSRISPLDGANDPDNLLAPPEEPEDEEDEEDSGG